MPMMASRLASMSANWFSASAATAARLAAIPTNQATPRDVAQIVR